MVDSLVAAVDAGGGAAHGTVKFYDGTMPAVDVATGGSNHLLVAVNLANAPSFPAADSSAQAAANSVPLSGTVSTAGTPTFFRVTDSSGNVVFQGTVGTSAADFIFANTTWSLLGTVTISSLTITGPV